MASPDTIARVKKIVAECLQIADHATVDDRTALWGGAHDLDSLDMLLVVTRIEKEFAIRITDRDVGRRAFATVASLADFVEDQSRGAPR